MRKKILLWLITVTFFFALFPILLIVSELIVTIDRVFNVRTEVGFSFLRFVLYFFSLILSFIATLLFKEEIYKLLQRRG